MLDSSLTIPILPSEDRISNWLHSYIRQENTPTRNSSTQAASKCALTAIAILRNLAFIPLSLKLPYANWAFATGNVVGVSLLDYWAGSRFIDDILPIGIGLEKSFSKKKNTLKKLSANAANVAFSFLSQIPSIYPAMQYNKGSLSIPTGVIVMLGGAVLPLRSIQLSIEKYFNLRTAKKQGIDPAKQKAFVDLLKVNKQRFINLPQKEPSDIENGIKPRTSKEHFIEGLEQIRNQNDSPEKILAYWNHLLSIPSPSPIEPLSGMAYTATLAAQGTGFLLTGIYQYVIGRYTFAKTKENVWDNDWFAGPLSGLVVASTLYLTGTSMVDSAVKLFHSITCINKDLYSSQETLAEKFRKKTVLGLQTLGHGINLLALGVTYVIWHDFFKNKTERTFFETTMCGAIFLLLHSATADVINDFTEQMLLTFTGTPEEKAAIKVSREYQTLIDSIEKLSPENFEALSPHLPTNNNELSPSIDSGTSMQTLSPEVLNQLYFPPSDKDSTDENLARIDEYEQTD